MQKSLRMKVVIPNYVTIYITTSYIRLYVNCSPEKYASLYVIYDKSSMIKIVHKPLKTAKIG